MRTLACFVGAAVSLVALPVSAAVINVSPADGTTAYKKIEAAGPGDEVVIAPGTYSFRVYLTGQGTASQPIYIHAADPANPPVFDPKGTLVDQLPGSYTAGDRGRGCWQVSGGTNYIIEGLVFQNCRIAAYDSAGLRYYNGTKALLIKSCLFQSNDNGLTGGTEDSDVTVEFSEFSKNGNTMASTSSPTHNAYIYGGTFTLRYSYLHDPTQGQNLHCRAVDSTIEYNWFDRAKSYIGDLMTSDDYANNPVAPITQTMMLRGNVFIQGTGQANNSQMWAMYNDEASGSPVTFSLTAIYNTVVGAGTAGAHAAFVHVSNADGTQMKAAVSNNIISGTSQPILVEDTTHATVTGDKNWTQTGATLTGITSSITGASPGFTNAAADDFTLAAGSACIGAADKSVQGQPVAEYYQNETVTREYRVRATALDIGAFEHTTTGPGIGPGSPMPDGGTTTTSSSSGTTTSSTSGTTTTSSSFGTTASSTSGAGNGASASSTSGGGAGATTSSTSGAGTGGAGGAGTPGSSGGCHCNTAADDALPAMPWALGLVAWAAALRRRARRAA